MDTCARQPGFTAGDKGGELARQRFRGGFVGQVQGQAAEGGGHGAGREASGKKSGWEHGLNAIIGIRVSANLISDCYSQISPAWRHASGRDGRRHGAVSAMKTRIEKDTFGPIEVPEDHLWGAQTQRSLHFFAISTEKMPEPLVIAMARLKRAAAKVNADLGELDPKIADGIIRAAWRCSSPRGKSIPPRRRAQPPPAPGG